jgi:hypothetical protein
MQERIWYKDVIDLGFTEQVERDMVYEEQYGFKYIIIELKLNKHFYIDWAKETGLCELVRHRKGWIEKKIPIRDLDHLKEIINIFN